MFNPKQKICKHEEKRQENASKILKFPKADFFNTDREIIKK